MDLFARQGFQGTTTRQIAQKAGVNEAIIFRHFPHKEDLYWAIIDHKCQGEGSRRDPCEQLGGNDNDREVFTALAEDMLRRNSEDTTLTRLLLFSTLEKHRLSHRFFRTYAAGYYERLASHIRRRIREGRFRHTDPLLAARGFVGMVIYHFLVQELFGGKRYGKFDVRRVSRVLTDIWLRGMQVSDGNGTPPKRRAKQAAKSVPGRASPLEAR